MTPEESAFDFDPPKELIAQEPLRNRSDARLLLVERSTGRIDHYHIRDLPELLQAGDRMVLNDTKVVPARMVGHRVLSGGKWQGLFLGLDSKGRMELLQKTRGKINPGEAIELIDREGRRVFTICLEEKSDEGRWLATLPKGENVYEMLEKVGRVPLPPYIRGGEMVDSDLERYQTIFAKKLGAVAAPTAGLHFTPQVLQRAEGLGIATSAVTLHVGLDTFRPISAATLEEHTMHSEWIEISEPAAKNIHQTKSTGGRIVAIGTTAVRVLESSGKIAAEQSSPSAVVPYQGETNLFIRPPYEFRVVDALVTNFHFPRTTLLTLVCTFAGRELMQKAYEEAIREKYRFFSYGDAMLIV